MNNPNDIPLLQLAILAIHGCPSEHSWTATVEVPWHAGVWQGRVEVFAIRGHPRTTEAFAWNYVTGDGRLQSLALLHIPPVETPSDAVLAAIAEGRMPRPPDLSPRVF